MVGVGVVDDELVVYEDNQDECCINVYDFCIEKVFSFSREKKSS